MATIIFPLVSFNDRSTINISLSEYAGFPHGISFHAEKESGWLIPDELFIQVHAPFHIVVGGCAEACGIGGLHFLL